MRSERFGFARRWAGALVVTVVMLSALVAQDTDGKSSVTGQRVFVTGHSFHAWMAAPLGQVAKSAGITDHKDAGSQMIGGSRVIQHWDRADADNKAKKAIRTGTVDVLTVSPHLQMPDEGIDKFTELLLEHNPNGRVYVQASWYPFDLPGKSIKDFKNGDRDAVNVADVRAGSKTFYEALARQVSGLNERLAGQHKRQVVFLVPVGDAVYTLRERIVDGKVPGVAKQSDLFTDGIGHPTPAVAVLATYCYYAAVYQRNPVGLPMPKQLADAKNQAWDEQFNKLLQEIAWEAVTNEPLSGVKKTVSAGK